jgi:predicted phosphodiesterase
MRELDCQVVRGNADRWLLAGLPPGRSDETQRLDEIVAWARQCLAADDREYLATLPSTLRVSSDGLDLFCFHGSPADDTDSLLPTTPAAIVDQLLAEAPAAPVLVAGHTHLQMLRPHRAALLVNPGSVGLPLDALSTGGMALPTWAEYALAATSADSFEIVYRRVPVDVDALVAATAGMPHKSWARDLAARIARWNTRG